MHSKFCIIIEILCLFRLLKKLISSKFKFPDLRYIPTVEVNHFSIVDVPNTDSTETKADGYKEINSYNTYLDMATYLLHPCM